MLQDAGIKAEGVRRGLDHGVWASFMCLFDPKKNPLDIPIVQVSLFDYFEADLHFKLGKAVAALREEGVQIICSGQAVHNLRDFGRTFGQPGKCLVFSFLKSKYIWLMRVMYRCFGLHTVFR